MVNHGESRQALAREWIMVAVILLGLAGDIAARYFVEATGARETSSKVVEISAQLKGLTSQVGELARAMAAAQVTASQVTTLAVTVGELSHSMGVLADKIGAMPRSDDVKALGLQQVTQGRDISDLQQRLSALGSVMETIQPKFRNTTR